MTSTSREHSRAFVATARTTLKYGGCATPRKNISFVDIVASDFITHCAKRAQHDDYDVSAVVHFATSSVRIN